MVSALGLLDHVQEQIEAIYDLERPAAVSDFLVDRRSLTAAGVSVRAEEEVLLVENGGENGEENAQAVDLGLYLAPELFERLRGKDPRQPSGLSLVTDGLPAFAMVAEGVSHVVYLLRCAAQGRQVSKLELEVQAEVDKFAVAALHLWGRGVRERAAAVWHRLFGAVPREGLSAEERDRYATAGNLARGYAKRLLDAHVAPGKLDSFLEDLRATYRLAGEDKLRAFAGVALSH